MNKNEIIDTNEIQDQLCKLLHRKLSDLALSIYAERSGDALTECSDATNYLTLIAQIERGKAKERGLT